MEENKVSKIVVKKDYELVDLIHKIENTDYKKVLLTFNESSDILISPINFKVLQKKADALGKIIVAQIIQNSAGVVNARNAGVEIIDTPGDVPVSIWKKAYDKMIERSKKKTNNLKGDLVRKQSTVDESNVHEDLDGNQEELESHKDSSDTARKSHIKEGLDKEVTSNVSKMEEKKSDNGGSDGIDEVGKKNQFNNKIDSTLKKVADQKGKSKVVEEDDFVMSVGGDISEVSQTKINKSMSSHSNSDVKKDFVNRSRKQTKSVDSRKEVRSDTNRNEGLRKNNDSENQDRENKINRVMQAEDHSRKEQKKVRSDQSVPRMFTPTDFKKLNKDFNSKHKARSEGKGSHSRDKLEPVKRIYSNFGGFLQKFFISVMRVIKKLGKKKTLYLFGGGFLIISGLIAVILYNLMSRVVIEIFIEKRPVNIEREFTGQDGSTFSIEDRTISVEKNEEIREREDSTETTGVGARGDKASGLLVVKCLKGETGAKMEISAGTIATTKDGKKFKIQSDINKACPSFTTATAEAVQVGEEYNVQSGTFFTIDGYNSDEIYADNTSAFTGGYKEEYPMVSEEDIKKVVKDLKKIVFDETEEALKTWGKSEGWEIIPSSIDHEVVDDPEPDYPVGSEADLISVKINVRSTALYYNKEEVEDNVENLLVKEAKDQKIFEGAKNVDKLKDIDYDINVSIDDEEKVKLDLRGSAMAKPEVDKEEILAKLEGKGWEEGNKYLEGLRFTVKDPKVDFEPEWIPKFTWKFPKGKNKIILKVIEIENSDETLEN